MTTTRGLAGAALMAAAFTMTAIPATAQDGKRPRTGEKSKPKVDWAKQKRAAAKKAEAEKKRAAAKRAAEEAERAEAEAAEAEEDAAAPAEEAATEELADGDAEAVIAEDDAAGEVADEEDAEDTADDAADEAPAEKTSADESKSTPSRSKKRRRRRHEERGHVPSPDRGAPPPYHWTGPYSMEYVDGAEIPDGYTKVERVRKGLVIGGAVTLGVSWLIAATAAASMDDNVEEETAPLFVPVIGPFIAIGTLEAEGAGRAALFVNGMAQVAGAAMLIGGLAATKTVLVRTRTAEINIRPGVGNLQLDGSF